MSAPSDSGGTFTVLVTGANDGLGYSLCTRLISNFLATRPSSTHLTLIPTTRSPAKATDTKRRLEAYIQHLATRKAPIKLVPRPEDETWPHIAPLDHENRTSWPSRVSIEPVVFDLCKLPEIYRVAAELREGHKRIDVVVCNAGIGGWTGMSWGGMVRQFFTEGIMATLGAPNYKICDVGRLTERQIVPVDGKEMDEKEEEEEKIGMVFCANLFGHYVLVNALLPLLYRREEDGERGRVVWMSTIEAHAEYFDGTDLQGFHSYNAYESSKRLTDLLVLTSQDKDNFYAKQYLTLPTQTQTSPAEADTPRRRSARAVAKENGLPPKMYLSHPGICVTSIFRLHIIMVYFQLACFYLARWLGSPWHNVQPEKGVTSTTWLILEQQEELDKMRAEEVKWGSAVKRSGNEVVRETDVEGMGSKGFERLGEKCWMEMEEVRSGWEEKLGKAGLL